MRFQAQKARKAYTARLAEPFDQTCSRRRTQEVRHVKSKRKKKLCFHLCAVFFYASTFACFYALVQAPAARREKGLSKSFVWMIM